MANFDLALERTLKHEGGYVNHPNDPGGETYRGISRKNWPDWPGWDLVDQAKQVPDPTEGDMGSFLAGMRGMDVLVSGFYKENFWQYAAIFILNDFIAAKIFDMAVNMGNKRAHMLLQRALVGVGRSLAVDGIVGPNTIAAANSTDPVKLYLELSARQAEHYAILVSKNSANSVFLLGWMRRAVS